MIKKLLTPQQQVINYFNNIESRLGYALLLGGIKHFGYYPEGRMVWSISKAQRLMEDKLAEKLNLKRNSYILDAGCGEGRVAIYLSRKYGLRCEGVDLLDWAVVKARNNAKRSKVTSRVNFQVMDYTSLSFPSNNFDGVFTMETLVHAGDYKKALREFRRVLKPKGKLVLFEYSTALRKSMSLKEQKIWDMIIEGSGMHSLPHFLHGKFKELLKSEGFTQIDVEDITLNVLPMLKIFYLLAFLPYKLIKLLKLQRLFINTTSAVEGYLSATKHDTWRYNIVTAVKP